MRATKNDFEIMCDELEKEEKSISCIRTKVKAYVGNDYNKFLKLKAEAGDVGYYEHVSTMMSIGAFTISVLSIFCQSIIESLRDLIEKTERAPWAVYVYGVCILIITALVAVAGIFPLIKSLKYRTVGKYRKYVGIILQEMERDEELFAHNVKTDKQ